MARISTEGFQELIDDMRKMEQQTGAVAESMIMAAAEVTRRAWVKEAKSRGWDGTNEQSTGDMIKKIGYPKKPTDLGSALSIDVSPKGKDKSGTRNAEKAFILHYGRANVDATYWVDAAEALADTAILPVLEEMWKQWKRTGRVPSVEDVSGIIERFIGDSSGEKTTKKEIL